MNQNYPDVHELLVFTFDLRSPFIRNNHYKLLFFEGNKVETKPDRSSGHTSTCTENAQRKPHCDEKKKDLKPHVLFGDPTAISITQRHSLC